MAEKITRLNRELVKKGAIIDYYQDEVLIPNGHHDKWDFINHKGAAACVAVLDDGRLIMVRQYRNALDRETIEIPAGGLNPGEPTIEAAARELHEETGYIAGKIEPLISIYTTVAFCNEKIDIYLATELKKGEAEPDEDEYVDIVLLEPDELVKMIFEGKIMDSKTVGAILAYSEYILDTPHD
ncbi:MAG: NUDIX hydrolase [Lachnospiraceae bacterium]|nr:NUDIX hydrolase [Lachnospiraceae bacterium]